MAKQKRIERTFTPLESSKITFTEVASGKATTLDVQDLLGNIKYADLPDMAKRLLIHGANAKFGDVAASSDKGIEEINSSIESVKAGNWTSRTGSGGARVTVLAEAMHQVLTEMATKAGKEPKSLDEVVDMLSGMTPEERRAIPKSYPAVNTAKIEIELKRKQEAAKQAKGAAKGATNEGLEAFL